jgi:rhodanese-related sulfurtransferase
MKTRAVLLLASLALVACDAPADKPADAKSDAPAKTEKEAPKPAEKAESETKTAANDPHAAFKDLSPDTVKAMLDEKGCVPVDANGKDTREKYGVLPGAVLLSDYKSFDTGELPEDKSSKLVFYCGGQACTAAPKAAKVAQEAGYEDVSVMRAGIRGWVDAGHDVKKPTT